MRYSSLSLLAQNGFPDDGGGGASSAALFFNLLVAVVTIAGLWKVFAKAGKPGWASLIPIYNAVVVLEIVGKPIWWILLLFIPCVNIVVAILVAVELANRFGKGAGFAVGMILLPFIFYPILGFGSAQYRPIAAQ